MDVPIYATDPIVRRAPALQATIDAGPPMVHIGAGVLSDLGLSEGSRVRVNGQNGSVTLPLKIDQSVPDGTVYIPGGYAETAVLGSSSHVTIVVDA